MSDLYYMYNVYILYACSSESDESSNSSDEEEKEEEEEKAVTSTVKDELPPEITSTNKSWLYRHSKSPSPKSEDKKKR